MQQGPKKMVVGFNHNVKHLGRIYHVQTEDSGLDNPHVITHLFAGGNILASKKTSYADIAGADNLAEVVRELMEEQHKEMLRNLINGVYDGVGDAAAPQAPARQRPEGETVERSRGVPTAPRSPPLSTPTPAAVRVPASEAKSSPPVPARAADRDTLFGEDLISEKSLDEVILSYLAEDPGGDKR